MSGINGQGNHAQNQLAGQQQGGPRSAQGGVTHNYNQYFGPKSLSSTFVFQNPGAYDLAVQYSNSSQGNGAQEPKPGMEATSYRRELVSSSQFSQSTGFPSTSPQ